MKIISISTDKKIFENGSPVLERSLEYASKVRELHIVVFSLKSDSFEDKKINNLFIYPTNSHSKLFYVSDAFKKAKEIIKKNEFSINKSVITCQDPFETGLVGLMLRNIFHFPLQIQVHTDFLSPYFKNNFLNRIRVFISKFTIPKADGIRVVSSVIKDSILERFKKIKSKIDILPIFVENNVFYDDKKSDTNIKILIASRLEQEKRIDVALQVFSRVSGKFNNIELLIAGDGSLRKELERKKIDKVSFLGWRDDVQKLFVESNIFLLTSDFEGYGMTLLQAGLFGSAIVTTKVGLAKTSLFEDGINSYVCEVGDVDCLSKKLEDLITNSEKRKSFSVNMRDSIKSISITKEDYLKKYIELQESLLTR
ncbi:MAG TPA: glycosyltransferase family 4 protein [Parcubacteria group bacterium]|jgi:glycosyltransferase involved in cell wall biosynthesis|nr:glycosyltransferase family 4 protein [Parcubacteria group bacterium]